MKIKEHLDMGKTLEEASKIAEQLSGGRTQIVVHQE
jgi:hypothetical protein